MIKICRNWACPHDVRMWNELGNQSIVLSLSVNPGVQLVNGFLFTSNLIGPVQPYFRQFLSKWVRKVLTDAHNGVFLIFKSCKCCIKLFRDFYNSELYDCYWNDISFFINFPLNGLKNVKFQFSKLIFLIKYVFSYIILKLISF